MVKNVFYPCCDVLVFGEAGDYLIVTDRYRGERQLISLKLRAFLKTHLQPPKYKFAEA